MKCIAVEWPKCLEILRIRASVIVHNVATVHNMENRLTREFSIQTLVGHINVKAGMIGHRLPIGVRHILRCIPNFCMIDT